ncbi:MAG: cupin domain-containing protein [Bryobacteraceae bacterium]|jgi:Uncharacterized conserved protein, contains double-stranded beta-helix domain|nr:cupin domain-containing protein [Bryobacteraceae bacterium]
MAVYKWQDVENEPMNPLLNRRVIHGLSMTVAKLTLKKGAVVPRHSHPNEQISMVESGKLLFIMDDGERLVEAGQVIVIPPNQPHRVEAVEDSVATDLFSPVRADWQNGNDAYLRSAGAS